MMKDKYIALALFIAIALGVILGAILVVRENQNIIIDNQKEIHSLLVDKNYGDSIHYDHLKNCSYIDRDNVKVGYNGVLYSAYYKKYDRKY